MEPPPLSIRRSDPPGGASLEVLWLHGLGSDGGGEKASLLRERMLARGAAFATLDFRGHGASGGRLRDLTCTGLLEDCGRAVRAIPAGRRVVLVAQKHQAHVGGQFAGGQYGAFHGHFRPVVAAHD
ncbi:MAG: alpha/beta hydrolase, partial [Planctomycetaceae bacterium]|nr:alpha/beta hydrolase [Planctomycetaceae bacterium]